MFDLMDFNKDPAETGLWITTVLGNVALKCDLTLYKANWLLTPPHNCVTQNMDGALNMQGSPMLKNAKKESMSKE